MSLFKTISGLLKKTLLFFISMLLVIDLCLIIFINTVNETVLNPDFIIGELDKVGFYSMLRERIIESVGDYGRVDVVNKSLPEGWVREKTNILLENILGYLNSETDTLDTTISLAEIKDNIPIPVLPDKIDLSDFIRLGVLEQLRFFLGYSKILLYLLISVEIILILFIVLLTRNLKSIFFITGSSSLLGGGISYGLSVLLLDLISAQIRGVRLFFPPETLLTILEDIMLPAKNYGIMFIIVGGVMLMASIILRILERRREARAVKETEKLLRKEIGGD